MDSQGEFTHPIAEKNSIFDKEQTARRLFHDRIVAIDAQLPQTGLYDRLLAKGLEGGLARVQTYIDPETREVLSASPIGMLNRNGFMYLVNNHIQHHGIHAVKFAMLDIGAVKQMDQHGAADYNLNRIAHTISELCQQTEYKDLHLLDCRYGGDEFAVAALGTLSPDQQEKFNQFQQKLQKQIAQLTWHRKQGVTGVEEHITSTLQTSEAFDSEQGDALYKLYLDRGVILPSEEINKMVREMMILKLQQGVDFPEQLARIQQKLHEYPPEVQTLSEKLGHHAKKHPEYKVAIAHAREQDTKAANQMHSEFVVEFIEKVVYDQLLGDNIVTFADFGDHYSDGAFADTIAIEGKFLKEANKINYLQGDNVKMGLWQCIKSTLDPALLSNITIANRAGSFLLGIPKGTAPEDISRIKEAMKNLTSARVAIRGNTIEVPLGVVIESEETEFSGQVGMDRIDVLRKISDERWYTHLVNYIQRLQYGDAELHEIVNTNKYSPIPDVGEVTREGLLPLSNKQLDTFHHVLSTFFQEPKRARERRQQMLKRMPREKQAIFRKSIKRKKSG